MASRETTIKWLRGLAEEGGKGVVNNIDARCLGRIADDLEALVKALQECQSVLAMMVEPDRIIRTSSMQAWTSAVAAETGARVLLTERVVGTSQVSGGEQ